MMKLLIAAGLVVLCTGCGDGYSMASGPTFRGEPPPGVTNAEYERRLLGLKAKQVGPDREKLDHDGGVGGAGGE